MSSLWESLKDSSSLKKDVAPAIERAAADAVRELALEGRLAELERARLARLARDWLEVEKARKDFAVVAVGKQGSVSVTGVADSRRLRRNGQTARRRPPPPHPQH